MVTKQSESVGAIAAAIGAAARDIGAVGKDKTMTAGGRYDYVSDEAITARAQPILTSHGLAVCPHGMEILDTPQYGGKGTPGLRVLVTWRIVHTSGEWITMQTIGEGMDSGDKAANKCMTAARKYLFRLLFTIPTGEDPDDYNDDGRASSHRAPDRQQPAPPPKPADPVLDAKRQLYRWVSDNDPDYKDRAAVLKNITGQEASRAVDWLELESKDETARLIRRLIDEHTSPTG